MCSIPHHLIIRPLLFQACEHYMSPYIIGGIDVRMVEVVELEAKWIGRKRRELEPIELGVARGEDGCACSYSSVARV
jgi:hypothetical protein